MGCDMEVMIGAFAVISVAIVGHAGATWYKLGRIEGKMDVLCKMVHQNSEDIGRLRNGKQDRE